MNTTVTALQQLRATVERKLWLAKTSAAYAKGTNAATVKRLATQLVALDESISHFSK